MWQRAVELCVVTSTALALTAGSLTADGARLAQHAAVSCRWVGLQLTMNEMGRSGQGLTVGERTSCGSPLFACSSLIAALPPAAKTEASCGGTGSIVQGGEVKHISYFP
jgi:hypothetical protein